MKLIIIESTPKKNIYIKDTRIYYLTTDFKSKRSNHIQHVFKEYPLTGVLPELGIGKEKSGSTGFTRILNYGLAGQHNSDDFTPFIILEDDVSKFRKWPSTISYPDDCDILFIGLSSVGLQPKKNTHENGIYYHPVDDNTIKIYNMLSTHGIMVCSYRGGEILLKCMKDGYQTNIVWDIFTAMIQPYYNVYALTNPLVYQDIEYDGNESQTKIMFDPEKNKEGYFVDKIHQRRLHQYPCLQHATKMNNNQ